MASRLAALWLSLRPLAYHAAWLSVVAGLVANELASWARQRAVSRTVRDAQRKAVEGHVRVALASPFALSAVVGAAVSSVFPSPSVVIASHSPLSDNMSGEEIAIEMARQARAHLTSFVSTNAANMGYCFGTSGVVEEAGWKTCYVAVVAAHIQDASPERFVVVRGPSIKSPFALDSFESASAAVHTAWSALLLREGAL